MATDRSCVGNERGPRCQRAGLLALVLIPLMVSAGDAAVMTVRIASGLSRPVFLTTPAGETDRLFIVEQHSGRIRILDRNAGTINATAFLTVGGLSTGNEQGLLGLAFHPSYASNGFFYVNFTDSAGTTQVRRYQVSGDSEVAEAGSATPVLSISQPQSNHNGGWIGFGPDGFLYISTGDGGGSNDSGSGHTAGTGNSQDITSNLLGKLLRIDVAGDDFPADANANYAIPPSNPFVGVSGDDEIWSYGLRNSWRPSFDLTTGDLYIADVGQNAREEVTVQPAASVGGENYGWRLREGMIATPSGGVGGPAPPGAIDPIYDYTHGGGPTQGFSVTGGYVYRGPIAELQGDYFFADFGSERIWSLRFDGSSPATFNGTNFTAFTDRTASLVPDVGTIDQISSFGEDGAGNLFILDLGGEVFEVIAEGAPTATPTATATSTPSNTPKPADCPALVDADCLVGFGRGFLLVRDAPGRERLVAKLLKGPGLSQTDMGNPLNPGGTIFSLCLYDSSDNLVGGSIIVDRAGDDCAGRSCWRSIGKAPPDGRGYKFKDNARDSNGVQIIIYRGGGLGKSKAIVKGKAANLPSGIPAALQSSASATVQLRANNGQCLSVTLSDVKNNETDLFRAR